MPGEDEEEETEINKKMTQSNVLQHRGGMDFFALARGGERSYSTSFLINLDPDLLALCSPALPENDSAYDLSVAALASHTQRIFRLIQAKSKREIDQVINLYPFQKKTLPQSNFYTRKEMC